MCSVALWPVRALLALLIGCSWRRPRWLMLAAAGESWQLVAWQHQEALLATSTRRRSAGGKLVDRCIRVALQSYRRVHIECTFAYNPAPRYHDNRRSAADHFPLQSRTQSAASMSLSLVSSRPLACLSPQAMSSHARAFRSLVGRGRVSSPDARFGRLQPEAANPQGYTRSVGQGLLTRGAGASEFPRQ